MHINTDSGKMPEVSAADLFEGFRRNKNFSNNAECTGMEKECGEGCFSLHFRPERSEAPWPILGIMFHACLEQVRDEYSYNGFRTECTRIEVESVFDKSKNVNRKLVVPMEDLKWMNKEILGFWGTDVANW